MSLNPANPVALKKDRVEFFPMFSSCPNSKVLYENYVPVSSDAELRNARGDTGGMGPEGQWRTEAGKSSDAKCHASLKLWEVGEEGKVGWEGWLADSAKAVKPA